MEREFLVPMPNTLTEFKGMLRVLTLLPIKELDGIKLKDSGIKQRILAMVATKLEEAELWAGKL